MLQPVTLQGPDGSFETEAIVVSSELGVCWKPASQWYTDAATGRRHNLIVPAGFIAVILDAGVSVGKPLTDKYEALCVANYLAHVLDWKTWHRDIAATAQRVREALKAFDAAGGWLGGAA